MKPISTNYQILNRIYCPVRSVKLNSVIVHFEDSQYDYETSVSAATTEESAKKYFVGTSFNMAAYPKELFKKCVRITFMDNNQIEDLKLFRIRFEGRQVNAIGNTKSVL